MFGLMNNRDRVEVEIKPQSAMLRVLLITCNLSIHVMLTVLTYIVYRYDMTSIIHMASGVLWEGGSQKLFTVYSDVYIRRAFSIRQ